MGLFDDFNIHETIVQRRRSRWIVVAWFAGFGAAIAAVAVLVVR